MATDVYITKESASKWEYHPAYNENTMAYQGMGNETGHTYRVWLYVIMSGKYMQ